MLYAAGLTHIVAACMSHPQCSQSMLATTSSVQFPLYSQAKAFMTILACTHISTLEYQHTGVSVSFCHAAMDMYASGQWSVKQVGVVTTRGRGCHLAPAGLELLHWARFARCLQPPATLCSEPVFKQHPSVYQSSKQTIHQSVNQSVSALIDPSIS